LAAPPLKTLARIVLVGSVALLTACPPPEEPLVPDAGPGRKCVGGFLRPDGTCEAKCDPSKCVANNTCVDNKCALKCTSHDQCQKYSQSCLPANEDDTNASIFVCTNVPPTEYGDPCPNGNECALNRFCYSKGPGDALSYCTMTCLQDTHCPAGYECGFIRLPYSLCGVSGIGNNNHCGRTDAPCVDPASVPADGSGDIVRGAFCLQQRMCLKKDICASCQTDVDCSWAALPLDCVDTPESGKRCLLKCTQETDCDQDKTCQNGYCTPKTGSCTGGGFCESCRFDFDCAHYDGGYACLGNENGFHGAERACIDVRLSTPCSSSQDCPLSAGGQRGSCVNTSQGGRCFAPYNETSGSYSCY
jgi:hypothetical protein